MVMDRTIKGSLFKHRLTMSKRQLSPTSEIPPAHRHCQRPAARTTDLIPMSPAYSPTSPAYSPRSPAYSPRSPYTGPIGSPPRQRGPSPNYDDCPSYSPTSPAYNPVRKYHPTFDRTDVMSPTYNVEFDPLRFAPIKPSKITTWTWPEMPKAKRPQLPLPEFDDDVECDEVASLCQQREA